MMHLILFGLFLIIIAVLHNLPVMYYVDYKLYIQ